MRNYLDRLYEDASRWALAFQMDTFTSGIAATQRVEGMFGNTLTRLLNRNSSLVDLYETVASLVCKQYSRFIASKYAAPPTTSNFNPSQILFKELLSDVDEFCTAYITSIIRNEMCSFVNYAIERYIDDVRLPIAISLPDDDRNDTDVSEPAQHVRAAINNILTTIQYLRLPESEMPGLPDHSLEADSDGDLELCPVIDEYTMLTSMRALRESTSDSHSRYKIFFVRHRIYNKYHVVVFSGGDDCKSAYLCTCRSLQRLGYPCRHFFTCLAQDADLPFHITLINER